MDRLESTAISAMKQSLRAWLPEIGVFYSFEAMLEAFPDVACLVAHEKVDQKNTFQPENYTNGKLLLLVGPEGGFSPREIEKASNQGAEVVSLGVNRLRTETAVVALLSQFL